MSIRTPRCRTGLLAVLVSLAGLLLAGCGERIETSEAASSSPTASPTASPTTSPAASPAAITKDGRAVPGPRVAVARTAPKALRPVRLQIPAIGVDATMTDLGIGARGAIEVPSNPAQAGWLETTPAPGQQGPAVVAGHVDSTEGPAVFYRLRELAVGDPITLTRRNGTQVTFTIDGVRTYSKRTFPTQQVYGPAPGPVLRLITCGGDYVKSQGGYLDNVVVYAS